MTHGGLLVLALAGCVAGVPITTTRPPKVTSARVAGGAFGVPGESIEYQVTLRGVTVGKVQVAVGEPGWVQGRRAVIIRSRGTSAGMASIVTDLAWELTTTLDIDSGYPIREREESTIVLRGEKERDHHDRTWSTNDHHNLHSAAGFLRGWRSTRGQRALLEVVIDSSTLRIDVWDAGREIMPAAIRPSRTRGTQTVNAPVVRYEGIARSKYRFAIWVTDDEQRVPVALRTESKFGAISIVLVDYDLPRE